MRALFFSVLGYFLTPTGVVLMGVLDASMIFFLPLGIDFVVIIMAARRPELFWLYPLLATIGSVAGAALTFWIGHKGGEVGLARLVNPKRLKHVKARVSRGAAVVAALAVIGTIVSAIALVRGSRKRQRPTTGSEAGPLRPRTARAATRPR